jgi:hypothetical protein
MPGSSVTKACILAAFTVSILACATTAIAQKADVPGAPKELLGDWGEKPGKCRSWHRSHQEHTTIESDAWVSCGGTACYATIISHRKFKDGYLVKQTSTGRPEGWTDRIRIINADKFEIFFDAKGDKKETYTRCGDADIVAGIGLPSDYDDSTRQEYTVSFAGYYARAVPTVCQLTAVDEDTVGAMTAVRSYLTPSILESIKSDAESAVEQDAKAIDEFCIEVFGAFGKKGTVTPNLLKDLRKKDATKTP